MPKRLFKQLLKKSDDWTEDDYPLPILRHLERNTQKVKFDVNAHDGYALVRAVYAGFVPLIRYLLDHGADPYCKDAMAIKIAIRADNLSLVQMLIERPDIEGSRISQGRKKRKLPDRVEVNAEMLRVAVKRGASDTVRYLMEKRGIVPSMQTLKLMSAG